MPNVTPVGPAGFESRKRTVMFFVEIFSYHTR